MRPLVTAAIPVALTSAIVVIGCSSASGPDATKDEALGTIHEDLCGDGTKPGCGPCYPVAGTTTGTETCRDCVGDTWTRSCVPTICGTLNEDCCPTTFSLYPCSGNPNLQCTNGTCQACGGAGQPCCNSGTSCSGSTFCSSGTCVACGDGNEPCCPGYKCNSWPAYYCDALDVSPASCEPCNWQIYTYSCGNGNFQQIPNCSYNEAVVAGAIIGCSLVP